MSEQIISIPFGDSRADIIRAAASSCGIPVEDFVLGSATERASVVLREAIEGLRGMEH